MRLKGNELGWIFKLAERGYDGKEFREWIKKNKLEKLDKKLKLIICKIHPNNFNPEGPDMVWILINEKSKEEIFEALETYCWCEVERVIEELFGKRKTK